MSLTAEPIDSDSKTISDKKRPPFRIFWKGLFGVSIAHAFAAYGLYMLCTSQIKLYTFLFQLVILAWTVLSVGAGAHRLFSHHAYHASWPLRLFFVIGQSVASQGSLRWWVRIHRTHHKNTDTPADPHDSTRGFFFCHIGWLMIHPTEEFWKKRAEIDVRDLDNDPIVYWQDRLYYQVFWPLFFVVLPIAIPYYFWNETIAAAWFMNTLRYVVGVHQATSVNSFAHGDYGMRPFDKSISATDNFWVAVSSSGEGWHNYHHVFPWDYRCADFPGFFPYNPATPFIDLCAKLGLASNLKTASPEHIRKRQLRTGTTDKADELNGTEEDYVS